MFRLQFMEVNLLQLPLPLNEQRSAGVLTPILLYSLQFYLPFDWLNSITILDKLLRLLECPHLPTPCFGLGYLSVSIQGFFPCLLLG